MNAPGLAVPGYALLGGRIFATSTDCGARHASRLREAGYGARLDLAPADGAVDFERPVRPERFHVGGAAGLDLETGLNVCRELDAWMQERVRVVVQCRDGLRDTGALLACYLVWRDGVAADAAIGTVRAAAESAGFGRAIPSDKEEAFVREWARMSRYLRT